MKRSRERVDPEDYIRSYRDRSLTAMGRIAEGDVAELIETLRHACADGRRIFVCGNGGSASTASHFAAGLGKDGCWGREQRFRVMALTDNVPWITSLANDEEYAAVFVEQLRNFAEPDDLLIAFSGSGNSPNIVRAVEWANDNRVHTVGITGRPGGKLGQIAKHAIFAESSHMGHIEEAHFLLQHLVSYYFEEAE